MLYIITVVACKHNPLFLVFKHITQLLGMGSSRAAPLHASPVQRGPDLAPLAQAPEGAAQPAAARHRGA